MKISGGMIAGRVAIASFVFGLSAGGCGSDAEPSVTDLDTAASVAVELDSIGHDAPQQRDELLAVKVEGTALRLEFEADALSAAGFFAHS